MQKLLTFSLLLCCFCFAHAQNRSPIGKAFGVITNIIDIHGEWVFFLDDSTCIHTYGSLVWGTESDTLGYSIEGIVISIQGAAENTILKNSTGLTIKEIKQKKYNRKVKKYRYKQEHFLYTKFLYPSIKVGKDDLIITLKINE